MNKNIKMLKVYSEVLKGNKYEIEKVIPNMYAKNFYKINFEKLKEINIDNLIIDIDGTLLPADDILVPNELIRQIEILKENDFNMLLVSNNGSERVTPVANTLGLKYLYNANKPLRECYDKALDILDANHNNVAMIGDQMLTDIYGANSYGIYSILVDPIAKKNNIGTFTNRCLQNSMEKYLSKKKIYEKKMS